jgi:hypothetical protein
MSRVIRANTSIPSPRGILLAGVLLVATATATPALEIQDAELKISGGHLVVDVSIANLFRDEVGNRLRQGMPATLVLTTDLWRDRSRWFDHMVATRTATYRVRYNVWSDQFELRRDEEDVQSLGNLDSLVLFFARPQRVMITEAARLNPDHRYYAALTAYLRPLTLKDLEDVEKYLGRSTGESPSLGSVAKLPSALVSFLIAVSGFEDEAATHRTRVFRVPESVSRPQEEPDSR